MKNKVNKKDTNDSSSKPIKPHKVSSYFIMPVVYTLILLVVALPLEFLFKDMVNDSIIEGYKNANEHSFYDQYSQKRELPLSDNETEYITYKPILQNEGYGKIICENVGLNCDVYRGIDSYSNLRIGVGSGDSLPGGDNPVIVYGYSTKYFKKLKNINFDDIVVFNTTYGKYTYKVSKIAVAENFDNASFPKSSLIMYCSNGSEPFDSKKPEKLYVVADFVSGPTAVEEVK